MRYTTFNAPGATVHDVEGRKRIEHVMEVDTEKGEVEVALWPLRLTPGGDRVETEKLRFRSIAPIYAGSHTPQLFHCYGPQG
jgi:hypothetical protein